MAAEIIVIAEQVAGTARASSLQALTAARGVAGALGARLTAVVAGPQADRAGAALGEQRAARVLVLDVDVKDVAAWAGAVAAAIAEPRPALVLAAHTTRGKDLAARVAALLDAPMASDCVSLSVDGGALVARRPVYAGKALVNVSGRGATLVASLRPNAVSAEPAPATPAVEQVAAAGDVAGLGAVLKDVVAAAQRKIELTEAGIVVSGGRGLKGPEHFAMIEDLASALGAAVGASRAVVDAGWRPHGDQVGQTGKTVSPQLYIAVAISGAIQHLAGMRTSKFIVAINKDAEAPIFKVADYGIVGDAFEVVPRLTEAVKALKAGA